jgi:hypothetical protein
LSFEFQIPLQNNSSDCGIFVLQYVETVVKVSGGGKDGAEGFEEGGFEEGGFQRE